MGHMAAAQGTVEAIYIASRHGELPHEIDVAIAHAGRGLEGDRNFDDSDQDSCNITLIEAEAFDGLNARHGFEITPLESRRQVLVRGVDLGDFVGRRFVVGDVECEGEERCEPCSHLVQMVGTQGVLRGLLHTGLRASIVKSGTIRPGDAVRLTLTVAESF
jgi:MOSC domain-containing protein YiiM